MQVTFLSIPLALVLLCGCAFTGHNGGKESISLAGKKVTYLETGSVGFSAYWLQKAEISYKGSNQSVILQMEADTERLAMVGVTPVGKKMFEIDLIGGSSNYTVSPFSRLLLAPPVLLFDVQLIFWPLPIVRDRLGEVGVAVTERVEDGKTERILHTGDHLLGRIEYNGEIPRSGRIVYHNLDRGYTLEIETLEYEPK